MYIHIVYIVYVSYCYIGICLEHVKSCINNRLVNVVMSKRGRDGAVLLDMSRCVLKRSLEFGSASQPKRQCLPASLKRSADFDIELDHMHKRLRATVPTAEEAIAFLIPHVTRLRNMYCQSQGENASLKRHFKGMYRAYQASLEQNASLSRQLDTSRAEVVALRRQVEMMKYRFVLSDACVKNSNLNP